MFRYLMLSVIIALVLPADAAGPEPVPTTPFPGGCPNGWLHWEDQCYSVPSYSSENFLTWADARTNCQSQGGELASIHSQSAQSFLTAEMEFELTDVWIGLSDPGATPAFMWSDNTTLDYTNWGKRQPDGYPGSIGNNPQTCAVMMSTRSEAGKWNDQKCDRLLPSYCQKPIDPSLTPPSGGGISLCNPGYESYFMACFRFESEPATFKEAAIECEKEMSHLASIVDAYEQAFVETLMFDKGVDSVWIGLRKKDEESSYVWMDDWPVHYTVWGPGEPSFGEGEGCVQDTTYGHWDDTNCTKKQPHVCKYSDMMKPTPAPTSAGYCPDGWVEYGSHCYIFYEWQSQEVTWVDAQVACAQQGSHLLTAHDHEENQFILMQWNAIARSRRTGQISGQDPGQVTDLALMATDPPSAQENNLWLGVVRNQEGGFEYFDGEPLNFVYWGTSEPHAENGYDCVVMMADVHGHWGTKQCDHFEKFGCKKPTLPATTGPTVITDMTSKGGSPTVTAFTKQTTPDDKSNDDGNIGLSVGAIIGIVIASVAGSLLALALGAWLYTTKRSSTPSRQKFENEMDIPQRSDQAISTA